ncbi:hypothetical protein CO686_01130 [Streptococcus oralis]|nr:hypothetical protein CO686_01130 [Streptococcus oralis]ORO74857.1 hypothetical protein B7710_00640 [Streptococcus oralis subsp. oralis]
MSLLSQKSPVSVAKATETFTTAGNIFLASLRLAFYLSFIVYCRFGQVFNVYMLRHEESKSILFRRRVSKEARQTP